MYGNMFFWSSPFFNQWEKQNKKNTERSEAKESFQFSRKLGVCVGKCDLREMISIISPALCCWTTQGPATESLRKLIWNFHHSSTITTVSGLHLPTCGFILDVKIWFKELSCFRLYCYIVYTSLLQSCVYLNSHINTFFTKHIGESNLSP